MASGNGEAKPSDLSLGKRLAVDASVVLLKGLYATLRSEVVGFDAVLARRAAGKACLFAFWHGKILLSLAARRRWGDVVVLVSRHGDGGLIARAVSWFGMSTARGSSTRGGAAAVRELARAAGAGRDVAFTPDGPRGPRGRVQMGVVYMARETGLPIFPIGFAASRCVTLSSWDRFQVPKPFARVRGVFAPPLDVPLDAPDADLETHRLRVEKAIHDATAEAERRAGLEPEAVP